MRVSVLLSEGRHPVSRRPRVSALEAQALALASGLGDARITALHAGTQASGAVLRPALGMGAAVLRLLDIPPGTDPLEALARDIAADPPDLVITGERTETAPASGMLPYDLAERLGWPLIESVTAISAGAGAVELARAEPGGRRRRLFLRGPAVLVASRLSVPARFAALGPMRRGIHDVVAVDAPADAAAGWNVAAAKRRPKRIAGPTGAARQGNTIIAKDAGEAADIILRYLQDEGLIHRIAPGKGKEDNGPI